MELLKTEEKVLDCPSDIANQLSYLFATIAERTLLKNVDNEQNISVVGLTYSQKTPKLSP